MTNSEVRLENIQRAIEAGVNVIATEGVRGVHKKRIGEDTGVTVRSLTRYFRTKEDYIALVLERMCRDDYYKVKSCCDQCHMDDKTGIEQLEIFFNSIQEVYECQERRILGMAEAQLFLRASDNKERIQDFVRRGFNLFVKIVEQCIITGQRDGSIKTTNVESDIAADTISATVWGLLNQLAFMKDNGLRTNDEIKNMFHDFFKHALQELTA